MGQKAGSCALLESKGSPESVLTLCKRGHSQGVVVLPQSSLLGDRGDQDGLLHYPSWASENGANHLYELFVESLCDKAAELEASMSHEGFAPVTLDRQSEGVDSGISILRWFGLESSKSQCERGSLQVWPEESNNVGLLTVIAADFNGTQSLEVKSSA